MGKRGEARVVTAVMAAVAGAGYASGRELVLFFAQTGKVGWIGVCLAPAVFGLLVSLLCRWGGSAGATGFIQFCRRVIGTRAGVVAGWLHGLLLALTAAVMLCGAGELGALADALSPYLQPERSARLRRALRLAGMLRVAGTVLGEEASGLV